MSDPLATLWGALEAADCRPRGKPYDFRARCPAHKGENRDSLHVQIGADERVLLWCFAHQCEPEAIVAALGLTMPDLFPDGHYRARRRSLRPARRSDFSGAALSVANVLHGLEELGVPWRLQICSACLSCGSPGAWLRAESADHVLPAGVFSEGRIDADCPEGCDADTYVQGLLGLLADQKEKP